MNQTVLGKIANSSNSEFCDCKIAHVAIWSVALSEAEVGQLAADAHPRTIQAANLVQHWELNSNANGFNGNNWTANGTISFDTGDNPTVDPPAGGVTRFFKRRIQ